MKMTKDEYRFDDAYGTVSKFCAESDAYLFKCSYLKAGIEKSDSEAVMLGKMEERLRHEIEMENKYRFDDAYETVSKFCAENHAYLFECSYLTAGIEKSDSEAVMLGKMEERLRQESAEVL